MAQFMNNFDAIWACLREHGISKHIARAISQHELRSWREYDLRLILSCVDATKRDIESRRLQSFCKDYNDNPGRADFVKPPWKLVQESSSTLKALCVDSGGNFSFQPPGAYAALTHVWEEGLGTDDHKRGLHRSLLDQIFQKVRPLGIRWLWIDSLSIPGGPTDNLNEKESRVKANLINAMAGIYREAKHVIVIDGLTLRLRSVDPIEVAVVLCCGRWMTRFWTYQEIKLAANAIVMTGKGSVNFSTIIEAVTIGARQNPDKYGFLAHTFRSLQRDDRSKVRLSDIVVGCKNREAGVRLDYARALFTVLGLEWERHYTLDTGMRIIYESQKDEAMRLVLYHGPARARHLGWAPAVLSGMRNSKPANPCRWTARGLVSSWYAHKIVNIKSGFDNEFTLTADHWSDYSQTAPVFRAYVSPEENAASLRLFQDGVVRGTARLLTARRLIDKTYGAPSVGLAVVKALCSTSDEGWVCLTLAIKMVTGLGYAGDWNRTRGNWLLFHENPTYIQPEEILVQDYQSEERLHLQHYCPEVPGQQDYQPKSTEVRDPYADQVSSNLASAAIYDDKLRQWTCRDLRGFDGFWDEGLEQWVQATEVSTVAEAISLPFAQLDSSAIDGAMRRKTCIKRNSRSKNACMKSSEEDMSKDTPDSMDVVETEFPSIKDGSTRSEDEPDSDWDHVNMGEFGRQGGDNDWQWV